MCHVNCLINLHVGTPSPNLFFFFFCIFKLGLQRTLTPPQSAPSSWFRNPNSIFFIAKIEHPEQETQHISFTTKCLNFLLMVSAREEERFVVTIDWKLHFEISWTEEKLGCKLFGFELWGNHAPLCINPLNTSWDYVNFYIIFYCAPSCSIVHITL